MPTSSGGAKDPPLAALRATRELSAIAALLLALSAARAGERIDLEVKETAGIRRFGYPVSAELKLERPVPDGARFRLLDGERLIPAQFRPLERREGAGAAVS